MAPGVFISASHKQRRATPHMSCMEECRAQNAQELFFFFIFSFGERKLGPCLTRVPEQLGLVCTSAEESHQLAADACRAGSGSSVLSGSSSASSRRQPAPPRDDAQGVQAVQSRMEAIEARLRKSRCLALSWCGGIRLSRVLRKQRPLCIGSCGPYDPRCDTIPSSHSTGSPSARRP